MIVVHGFGPYFGMPEASPFVMKTLVHLQLAGLDYEHRASGVAHAPKGKVPYLEDNGETIYDSSLIREHIEGKYRVDLDAGLGHRERMTAHALSRMLEEHLYFALIDLRWRDDGNFDAGPAHFFDRLPLPVRPLVRRIGRARIKKTLYFQGIGRLPRADVEEAGLVDLDSLSEALGDKPFMMGEQPTALDGFAFGVLLNLAVPVFKTALKERIGQDERFSAYLDRMTARFFPSSGEDKSSTII